MNPGIAADIRGWKRQRTNFPGIFQARVLEWGAIAFA